MPVLSVLSDTLTGDAEARPRQVWVFTLTAPSLGQRAASAVPFLYHRLWNQHPNDLTQVRPVLDMGEPSRGIWTRVGMAGVQAEVINPAGAIVRLATRSYGGNLSEYRTTHLWEALDVISPAADTDSLEIGADQLRMIGSRLQLSGRMFGVLVSDDALPRFYDKYQTERAENRGHNWEVLRQAAEDDHLYFEPLAIGGMTNSFAMVWAARGDLQCNDRDHARRFDPQFLKIASPFGDAGLCHWSGYTRGDRIPLALYSLDYPGVPLLLVDFRRAGGPTRAEMTLRAADDVTTGVLGLTGFGSGTHLGYQALKSSWLFIKKRHGGTTDRAMRRRAFVQLRHALGTDDSLDPALRKQLETRLDNLDLNPVERSWDEEVKSAWIQYDALLRYADDPAGMPEQLQRDRDGEARRVTHGTGGRALLRMATIGSFGFYRHRDELTPPTLELIAASRTKAVPKSPQPPEDGEILIAGGKE